MNSFKISKKEVHKDDRMSIHAKHTETIEKIENEKQNLQMYIKQLDVLMKIKNSNRKKIQISKIDDQIKTLQEKIDRIKNDTDMSEYLFKSLEFIAEIDNLEYTETDDNNSGDIFNFISITSEKKNEDLYRRYMATCFPNETSYSKVTVSKNRNICPDCNVALINDISSGISICYDCGLTETYNFTKTPEWNSVESHDFIKPYSYKRTNHFKEWIVQIQGREGTFVPEEVINLLLVEIRKERLFNKSLIAFGKIKEFLKKLKLNKYYEHIPNIIHKITGNSQLVIDDELETKLLDMFNKIQEPFEKHCPKNRKNFLSYSYTLYKFFQLLKKDEYLIYFPLLKSREKLFEQENIWKGICSDLDWEFIKCI